MNAAIKLPRVLRMFLLGALLLQAALVQTLVHYALLAASAQVSAGRGSLESVGASHQQLNASDYCPLCWEAAMAGHYSLPPAAAAVSAPPAGFWFTLPIAGAFALAQPPHGWLSRAPPR
jgi:hypothetical protein